MLKKLVNKILVEGTENNAITVWIAGFTVIVFIRSFLEVFSTISTSGFIASDAQRVHYFLFFLTTALLLAITVTIFTKQKSNRVVNLTLYGLPIIFLAPIIDLIINAGKSVRMDYIFDTNTKLFLDFLTFFGTKNGVTYGIRIEIFIILCAIGWYVWMKRSSFVTTIGAVAVSYTLIFAMLALPGILYSLSHISQSEIVTTSAVSFIEKSITASNIPSNILHGSLLFGSYPRLFTLGISAMFSQLFFVLSFIAGTLLFWYTCRNTTKKVLGNARVERILFYMSLLVLGALYAHTQFSVVFTWVDWLSIIVIALSWFSAWMFAVHTNDIADIKIDTISNSDRPLPKKTLSVETMRDVGFMWLTLSLVGSYIVGYYVFFMNIIFTSAYYLYSAPPLRFKQVPIVSSFLISIACLATILAGFFFVSSDKTLAAFPILYALGIVVVFTLGVNVRDIKDVEGDKLTGIQTLPVIFDVHGKQVVGVLLAISFLLAPFFFPFFTTYTISIPVAFIGYWLCVRETYNEKYIFILYFMYFALSLYFV